MLIICLIRFNSQPALAQGNLSISNMAEFQLGNIPNVDPSDLTSLYDQLNISYAVNSFLLRTRIEQFYPSYGENRNYVKLSQYYARFDTKNLNVTVGNTYTMLGLGLLLRTYEIPGTIWETRGYRVRYGFYRDLSGFEAGYKIKRAEVKLLRGRVLDISLPPVIDKEADRRPDLVEGGQFTYRFTRHLAGMTFMRHTNANMSNSYSSVFYNGSIGERFLVSGELAFRLGKSGPLVSFSDDAGYGIYAGINYTDKRTGISFEIKDYQNMSIGTGITDPPTLVREHSYKLLNRSTHVPVLTDESGYQFELYYSFSNTGRITFNHAFAKNEFPSEGNSKVFREYFSEYQFPVNRRFRGSVFADYSYDQLVNEDLRITAGFVAETDHSEFTSMLESQFQHTRRSTIETVSYENAYIAYTLSRGSKYSISAILEFTNDPAYVSGTPDKNYLPAINISFRPDNHNRITLFAGKRRGGPACTSGVCYDVLDFTGIECRINTRF